MADVYHDTEFGDITVHRSARSRQVKLSVAVDGTLRASMPHFTSSAALKKLVASSRKEIRSMLQRHLPEQIYEDGMQIGKSHSLIVQHATNLRVYRDKLKLIVSLPDELSLHDSLVQREIRTIVIEALRVEAKHYLPKRLKMLAGRLECTYERVRFSHASSRWGSCSSSGTISLNIALMKLPFELIDYVIIHELCHTKEMNHSKNFWSLVAAADPEYKQHRTTMKTHTPTI